MTMRALLAGLILAVAAGAASAQDRAANLEAARALIERAQLSDVFAPFEDDAIAARHAASGLVCRFYPDDTRRELLVFNELPRGEDVGCVRDREGRAITFYATRYAPAISPEQSLAIAVEAIRQRFPDAQPVPATLSVSSEALPPMHVAHFLITVRGERWLTTAIVAQVGDWIYKLRFSARALDADELRAAELEANVLMAGALLPEAPPSPRSD